jgi:hypothetical protein
MLVDKEIAQVLPETANCLPDLEAFNLRHAWELLHEIQW